MLLIHMQFIYFKRGAQTMVLYAAAPRCARPAHIKNVKLNLDLYLFLYAAAPVHNLCKRLCF